jgi:hypothetical protein
MEFVIVMMDEGFARETHLPTGPYDVPIDLSWTFGG